MADVDHRDVQFAVQRLGHVALDGVELLEGVVLVDQSPIGRTPRSNPVTYIKAYDEIRKVSDGLYLGVGEVGWGPLRRPSPFLLQGPAAPFEA